MKLNYKVEQSKRTQSEKSLWVTPLLLPNDPPLCAKVWAKIQEKTYSDFSSCAVHPATFREEGEFQLPR